MTVPTVAALYVETDGCYSGLEGVEPWNVERDARLYAGPHPVVAHPPCQRWCALAGQIETRFGYRVGDDDGCFAAALDAVRTFGGVLEHPAHSRAWNHFRLPEPPAFGWTTAIGETGWACEVEQGHYGHPLRKPTWLYYVGPTPPPLLWGRGPGGTLSHRGSPLSEQARRKLTIPTPPAFRDVLLETARSAALVAA